jgi:hypothetical protein
MKIFEVIVIYSIFNKLTKIEMINCAGGAVEFSTGGHIPRFSANGPCRAWLG